MTEYSGVVWSGPGCSGIISCMVKVGSRCGDGFTGQIVLSSFRGEMVFGKRSKDRGYIFRI